METIELAEKKRLKIFIAITFIIAWILFLSVPLSGTAYGSGSSIIMVAAAMFAPALGNILTRLITKEGFGNLYLRPRFKGHIPSYVLVYFGPSVLLFISCAFYFLIFPGQFDSGLTILKSLAVKSGKPGMTASTLLLLMGVQILIIGPIINIIPTFGEEFGWRAYLLPKLRLFFSDRAALVITGVIWGLWHAPVIVLGHNYGTSYFGYPYLGILMMVVFCVMLGIIEGYFTLKLKSCIPAAMIHSAVNAAAGLPIYFIRGSYNTLLGPAITGLIGGLPFIAVAVYLLLKSNGHREVN